MLDTKSFHPCVAVGDNILRNVRGVNVFQPNLSLAPSRLNSFKRIPVFYKELIDAWETFSGGVLKGSRTKSPGKNPPGQNPPWDKIPLDKISLDKSPRTKSPHYI